MKKILMLVVVGVVVAGAYVYMQQRVAEPVPGVGGVTVERVGTIVKIDLEQAKYDGPVVVTMRGSDGTVSEVAVPSMGLPLCAAYKANNIGDAYSMKVGEEIEVRGVKGENGAIAPCESADHYLRLVSAKPAEMTLITKTWSWVSAQYNDGRVIMPKQTGKFTLTFTQNGGRFSATTDCNSMGGSYSLGADGAVEFSNIFSTKMYCKDSQEGEFAMLLQNISKYHFTSKGELIFELKYDSGTVTFQ